MPISNNGPLRINVGNNKELRMFVCEDGIVMVSPSFSRHLPGQLVTELLGGAIGGGIGGAIKGAISSKEYQEGDEKAKAIRFASAERLAASVPRSRCIPADHIRAVRVKRRLWTVWVTLVTQKGQPRSFVSHKYVFSLYYKNAAPVLTSLRELFGNKFQAQHDQRIPDFGPEAWLMLWQEPGVSGIINSVGVCGCALPRPLSRARCVLISSTARDPEDVRNDLGTVTFALDAPAAYPIER
jgi:hypothetical protein